MSKRPIIFVVVLALVPMTARAAVPSGCSTGSAHEAARALIHPGGSIVAEHPGSAIAMAPFIAPGTPFTLLHAENLWCDAQAGFNHIRFTDPVQAVTTFAANAATPWFGSDVTVTDLKRHGDSFNVVTHARRNGIRARWQIVTDARGIVSATFRATRMGVEPFEKHMSGMTALPGLTRTWVRAADGALVPTEPVIPKLAPSGVEDLQMATVTASDGFMIRIRRSNLPLGPTLQDDTGVRQIDLIPFVRDVTLENYEEFLDWGLTGNSWAEPVGDVYIDDDTGLTCLACVYIDMSFQIHMLSEVITLFGTPLFGIRWTDDDLGFSTVVGHEMFHNFQNAAMQVDTNLGFADGAWSEGTARMSEALHTYSHTSHVSTSLIYDQTINGCNGYLRTSAAVQEGPATDRLYDACAFWLTWYGRHGVSKLADLLAAMKNYYAVEDQWEEMRATIEEATGAPVEEDLAHFAGAIITRRGFVWSPVTGGDPIDWSHWLEQWFPPTLALGGSSNDLLRDGAMLGNEIESGGTVTVTSDEPVSLYSIRDTGSATVVTPISSGATVAPPGAGEHVYLIAIYPGFDQADVTISLEP